MTQSFVTQCPHCRTSFRVSLTQLNAAHGAVRCGACLHVFNAAHQLREQGINIAAETAAPVTPPRAPTPTPAPPPPPAPAPSPTEIKQDAQPSVSENKPTAAKDDTLWIHDDLDLSDLDLDEELAKLQAEELDLSSQFLELDKPASQTSGNTAPKPETDTTDERWAEELLEKEQATEPHVPLTSNTTDSKPDALRITPLDLEKTEPSIGTLNESEADTQEPAFTPFVERDATSFTAIDDNDQPAPVPPKRSRSEPRVREEHLLQLDDEPLQLNWQKPHKPWGRWIGWGLLNLLAALGLAGQYVAYNFAELSRQDQYRPWFEQLCPTLGCTLPSKVDIDQIKSSNLVVRSHPEFSGALVVDAIIYNRASFSQPFPLLEMRFADVNGKLLASRRFKPSEYLAGELAGNAEMPQQTPIHISLDILDPGTQAVNYSLSFHSPE